MFRATAGFKEKTLDNSVHSAEWTVTIAPAVLLREGEVSEIRVSLELSKGNRLAEAVAPAVGSCGRRN